MLLHRTDRTISRAMIARLMAGLFALITASGLPALAHAADSGSASGHCFRASEFQSWRAANPSTIYIRVGLKRYFKLELQSPAPQLLWPDVHLVTVFHGPSLICTPLDWGIPRVVSGAVSTPLSVKSMTELSAAQVARLPKKDRP